MGHTADELTLLIEGVTEWQQTDREFSAAVQGAKIKSKVKSRMGRNSSIEDKFEELKQKGLPVEEAKST